MLDYALEELTLWGLAGGALGLDLEPLLPESIFSAGLVPEQELLAESMVRHLPISFRSLVWLPCLALKTLSSCGVRLLRKRGQSGPDQAARSFFGVPHWGSSDLGYPPRICAPLI